MRESKSHRLNKPVDSAQSTTSRCILPQCPLIPAPINAKWCLTNAFVHGISVMHRLVSNHWYTIIRIEISINGQRVKLLQTSLNIFFRSETIDISMFLQWQRRPWNWMCLLLAWLQGGTFHMHAFFWRMVKQVKLHFAKYWHVSSNRVDRLQNPMYVVTLDVAHSNETIFKFCYGKIYKWSVY